MPSVYLNALSQRYADFRTRTRRREFWEYTAWNAAVYAVFLIALALESRVSERRPLTATALTLLGLLVYAVLTLVPTLAITVRRLHDIGRSGLSLWRMMLPNSWLWLLLNLTFDSQTGSNNWGPNPKTSDALSAFP